MEAGEPEGLVVRALRQVSGYGRQGRSWTSPEGGLYCSLLLRPQVAPRELPTLSLVVGMAVRRALVALAGARAEEAVRIKWPNDVVLAQRRAMHDFLKQPKFATWGFESGRN
ncbi:MAG: biotin--[acetyl-CoA-carboxylase] ligase [Eggerthellaceae bacterium]